MVVVEDRAQDSGDDAKSSFKRILMLVKLKALMLIAIGFIGICLCLLCYKLVYLLVLCLNFMGVYRKLVL